MKLTSVLCAQHIGRMFKKHWRIQSKRVPLPTRAEESLKANGITVYEPNEILKEETEFEKIELPEPLILQPPAQDSTHPLYNERVCHMYRDHNVLLEGLRQAKVLTKTVEIKEGLPEEIENLVGVTALPQQDALVRRNILMSHVFDAMQLKLPKLHDPERPAWNFPRVYGITDKRRNDLLSLKLVHLCEMACGRGVGRSLMQDERVCLPFEKDGDLIQLDLTVNFLLNSTKALPAYASLEEVRSTHEISLPDLYPVKHTVTLTKENIYEIHDIFPVLKGCQYPHVHTAILHYEDTEVKNLYEEPVTEEQILGRTLMKAFAVAAANAKQKFGVDVKDLPEPITLQCVHTDGRLFHFAVLQLNTLNLDGTEGTKNILWSLPRIPLFSECKYEDGKPSLKDYNEEVFQRLLAFYANSLKF